MAFSMCHSILRKSERIILGAFTQKLQPKGRGATISGTPLYLHFANICKHNNAVFRAAALGGGEEARLFIKEIRFGGI